MKGASAYEPPLRTFTAIDASRLMAEMLGHDPVNGIGIIRRDRGDGCGFVLSLHVASVRPIIGSIVRRHRTGHVQPHNAGAELGVRRLDSADGVLLLPPTR